MSLPYPDRPRLRITILRRLRSVQAADCKAASRNRFTVACFKQPPTGKQNQALDVFLEAMRVHIVQMLSSKFGEQWPNHYKSNLSPEHQIIWIKAREEGRVPEELIDYPHLSLAAQRFKDLWWTPRPCRKQPDQRMQKHRDEPKREVHEDDLLCLGFVHGFTPCISAGQPLLSMCLSAWVVQTRNQIYPPACRRHRK